MNLMDSVVIGDKATDILMGKKAGLITILLRTGHGRKELKEWRNRIHPDHVARDILEAARWLRRRQSL